MTDLREQLEALSAEATQGEWVRQKTCADTYIGPKKWGFDSLAFVVASFETHQGVKDEARDRNLANAGLIAALVNAWRDGAIVTRSEMEEAVAAAQAHERLLASARQAAAVAKEREIKEDALRVLDIAAHHDGFVYPKHRMRAEEVLERARSEQKEGE